MRKKTCCLLLLVFGSTVAAMAVLHIEGSASVAYPDGFRKWTHVKSGLIGAGSPAHQRFGGLHHIYANDEALRGYQSGHFAEGSVLVFDLFNVATANDVTNETSRRQVDVMHKDSKRYSETGGWGFEEFRGDSHEQNEEARAPTECFNCHAARKEHDYVFSALRD